MSTEAYRRGYERASIRAEYEREEVDEIIERMRQALITARRQLVTLGGEALNVHGDGIQRAVLNEIDAALSEQS